MWRQRSAPGVASRAKLPTLVALVVVARVALAGQGAPSKPPASSEAPLAIERAKILRDRIERFELVIRYRQRWDTDNPPFNSLTMRTWDEKEQRRPDWPAVRISRERAAELVDLLARNGFLARASDESSAPVAVKGVCYMLFAAARDPNRYYVFYENLGWDLATISRLDQLGSLLDGDAAAAMAALLAKLKPSRDEWQKAAADPDHLKAQAREVEDQIRAYLNDLKAGGKPKYRAWREGREALMPLLIPHLLASSDVGVRHEALVIARDLYGRQELVPAVIATLENLLKNPREDEGFTRMLACEVLALWPDLRSVPVLLKALDDPYIYHGLAGNYEHVEHIYRAVWWEADAALRLITWANPAPKPLTHRGEMPGQREAARAAWEKWWQENRDRLLKNDTPPWEKGNRSELEWQSARLNHMEPHVRADALKALGQPGGNQAIKLIIRAMADDEYGVHTAAIEALAKMGPPAAEPLIASLKDQSPAARRRAADALGLLRDRRALQPLAEAMKDPDRHVADAAAYALTQLDPPAVDVLLAALKDDSAQVRVAAAQVLHVVDGERVFGPLGAAMKDNDQIVREAATYSLVRMGDKRAVEPFLAALKDDAARVRAIAAEGLGNLGDKRAVEPLIAALSDQDSNVRVRAAESLGRLGDERAVEPLKKALHDPVYHVRTAAEQALKLIEARKRPAKPKKDGAARFTDEGIFAMR